MTARQKFNEAEFFLEKLSGDSLSPREIGHYFSAFLSAVNSIFDHLLEDANQKFVLGIPIDDRLNRNIFRRFTEYSGNIRAKFFIDWYDSIFNKIKNAESGKIFHIERNLNTHRRIQIPQLVGKIKLFDDPSKPIFRVVFVAEITGNNTKNYFEQAMDYFMKQINQTRIQEGKKESLAMSCSFYFALEDKHEKDLVQSCCVFLQTIKETVIMPSKSIL